MANDENPDENPNSFIHEHLERGDATGWFEEVYARAQGNGDGVPWAVLRPRPAFVEWAQRTSLKGKGKRALVVGCGLGDDAEELARRGFAVTSFDIAPSAVAWCQQRFLNSKVDYRVADLFAPPAEWHGSFDFVLEIFTIQALPIAMREQTIAAIARFVAKGGEIFVLTRAVADPTAGRFGPPWPLTRAEVDHFRMCGLTEVMMEELPDGNGGLGLSLRALYRREA